MTLLRRTSRRWFLRHRSQLALAVGGVAIGVALVVAIGLALRSALRSFERSVGAVGGAATHEITGPASGFDEGVWTALRTRLGVRAAAPSLTGWARFGRPDRGPERVVQVLGVDVFAEAPLRPELAFDRAGGPGVLELAAFLTEPGAIALTGDTARSLGLGLGSEAVLAIGGVEHAARVVGVLEPADEVTRNGLESVVVADLATAQELFARAGRLDRIALALPREGAAGEIARIAEALPAGLELRAVRAQGADLDAMTRSFRVNLQALGLLSLLVGAFLVFHTMQFAVVQRRESFGTLRAIGATRAQVLRVVLGEAIAIGAVGTVLGIGLGIGLGEVLLGQVERTVTSFWARVSLVRLEADAAVLVEAAVLALLVTVAAALWPAIDATRSAPRVVQRRSQIEARTERVVPRAALLGALLVAAGWLVVTTVERRLVLAFVGLFAVLLGAAFVVPLSCACLLRGAAAVLRAVTGPLGALVATSARANLSRVAVAIAALTLAVASTVGVGAMVGAFRATVERWLGAVLVADAYVSVPREASARLETRFGDGVLAAIASLPEVAALSSARWVGVEARVPGGGRTPEARPPAATEQDRDGPVGTVQLAAIDRLELVRASYPLVDDGPGASRFFAAGEGVLVSEPFAFRRELAPGDVLELRTDRGWRSYPVAGVFEDYATDAGYVVMARAEYERAFDDRGASSATVFAAPGVDAERLVDVVRATAARSGQVLLVRSDRTLRDASLRTFDHTFAITEVLRLLCIVVAVLGMWSSLAALQLERQREFGVLRALGATPRRVVALVVGQSGLLGLCAGLLALPLGALLARALIDVVNRESFGWTLRGAALPAGELWGAIAIAVAAGLCAGVAPGLRMARVEPARALQEE